MTTSANTEPGPDLVTFGETMASFVCERIVPIRHATSFRLAVGGAESNTAIGVARLGHRAHWMGRVGADELGARVLSTIRGEGVAVDRATVDPEAPTGLMVKGRRAAGGGDVQYYRHGSAGSRLQPEHLDLDAIQQSRVLHVTGITAALSKTARDAVLVAIEIARRAGVLVSFDPNYRAALWTADDARPWLNQIATMSDIVLAGADEVSLMCGEHDPLLAALMLARRGIPEVVVRLGGPESVSITGGAEQHHCAPMAQVVDPVGTGDAFAAGYLAGVIEGQEQPARLQQAATVAAAALEVEGDWEGLPHRWQLAHLGGTGIRR